jgi:UDP-N-acetylmuramyl pentapeptide phosphotransferase/UDP-N-acetylglucosamine-1-phosphate transferase
MSRRSGAGAIAGRAALIGLGVLLAHGALKATRRRVPSESLERTNFHGRTVTLAGGPALAAASTLTAAAGAGHARLAAAALLAGGASGAVGLYDDIVGARPDQKASKGFRGHLAALRKGKITSGMVKIAGVGLAALEAAALAEPSPPAGAPTSTVAARGTGGRRGRRKRASRGPIGRAVNVLLGAGVIAGTANMVNLLDLRPGRALKAGLIASTPLLGGEHGGLLAGPAGAAAALLRPDLDEEVMLGDTGANALGALIGLSLAARCGPVGRAALLAVLAGLTVASEKVSFTSVIESTPVLRELDALGRRTDHADAESLAGPDEPPFVG